MTGVCSHDEILDAPLKAPAPSYVLDGFWPGVQVVAGSGRRPRRPDTAIPEGPDASRPVRLALALTALLAACGGEPPAPRVDPSASRPATRPGWQTRVRAGDTVFDEVRFNLLPFLRRPVANEDESLLVESGPAGLALEYRIDWPGGSATVRRDWLRAWGVDVPRVAREARRNLIQRHARLPLVKVRTDDGSSVLQLEGNSPYQQSLVLLDVFWDKIAAEHVTQGEPLVAIPDRSRLIVLGSAETDLIAALGPTLREFYRDSSESLLDRFLRRDERGAVVAGPPF
jgi:hypothetical protein